jgi:Zn-dependent protease
MDASTIRDIVIVLVPMILSLTVHEYAHARSAYWLGDDTAASNGRMTLNPLSHIDLFGTILIPVMSILLGGLGLFGWARPVPVSPQRFSKKYSMHTGMIITAMAGPGANLVFAFVLGGVMVIMHRFGLANSPGAQTVMTLVVMTFRINVVLAIFNMIPIYPLDGSRLLPANWQLKMAQNGMLGMIILLFLINAQFFRTLISLVRNGIEGFILGFWSLFL